MCACELTIGEIRLHSRTNFDAKFRNEIKMDTEKRAISSNECNQCHERRKGY